MSDPVFFERRDIGDMAPRLWPGVDSNEALPGGLQDHHRVLQRPLRDGDHPVPLRAPWIECLYGRHVSGETF